MDIQGTPPAGNNSFLQWRGSVSSLFSFSLFTLCRGTGRNWSVLAFRFASLPSPPKPRPSQAPTLGAMPRTPKKLTNKFSQSRFQVTVDLNAEIQNRDCIFPTRDFGEFQNSVRPRGLNFGSADNGEKNKKVSAESSKHGDTFSFPRT